MKQVINTVTYKLKGEVIEADENIIRTQIMKKEVPEEDFINIDEFKRDIVEFCEANIGKAIDLAFTLKVTEE